MLIDQRLLNLCAAVIFLGPFVVYGWTPGASRSSNGKIFSLKDPTALRREGFLLSMVEVSSSSTEVNTDVSKTEEEQQQAENATTASSKARASLTEDLISKLRYRELRKELETRALPVEGTTRQLRDRLSAAAVDPMEKEGDDPVEDDNDEKDENLELDMKKLDVRFEDRSDPDFEAKEMMREIESKASMGHWKGATRKLKRLTRRHDSIVVPESLYLKTLEACMANRLQGARASEPARKILEQMAENGYAIPEQAGNYCIKNSLGEDGETSTHQGFGGVDTALAMLSALEQAGTTVHLDTYDKLCVALAKDRSISEALQLLRTVVVERSETPPLSTFADVASAAVASDDESDVEKVLTLLVYAKAAGYELDNVAAIEDGRSLLAYAVIAAEKLNNVGLGLRLLTSASKAPGVEPDRGDDLVASSSAAAQRACMLIHRRAIAGAVEDGQWELAVKLLQLMLQRSLKPSAWVWRNVVTCCAKAEKSKKSTALLMDWIKLYEAGQAEKPPLSVFNTCVNACEICNEKELTVAVLDAMKKTHETEGNLITFNIALKRLAKLGNYEACEGILVGMLKEGVEPSVVSYTTAIAACATAKEAETAYTWLQRMRSRNVHPNILTYNTALASCLDAEEKEEGDETANSDSKSLAKTVLASKIAAELLADATAQLQKGSNSGSEKSTGDDRDGKGSQAVSGEYTSVMPDATSKNLASRLLKQLEKNWKSGAIDERVAKESIAVPLTQLAEYEEQTQHRGGSEDGTEDELARTRQNELELEYLTASMVHRTAEV